MFQDIEGNVRSRSDWDKHHVFAQSRAHDAKSRRFIGQAGLVLPMFKEFHNQGKNALHNNVGFPSMPSARLQHMINQMTSQDFEPNPYDRFLHVSELIAGLAMHSLDYGVQKQCERISDNLALQTPFILLGMVERVEV
jgi:hypothetical protein